MYFLGQTPVEPTGVPTAATLTTPVVEAVVSAVEAPAAAPSAAVIATTPEPTPAPAPAPVLPMSVSTGAPAPTDYSQRRESPSRHHGHESRHRSGGWYPTPVNIFYTDPVASYYPPYPQEYLPPQQQPIYVIRERNVFPRINWLLVLGLVSLLYVLKR